MLRAAEFDESQHPRDDRGRFGPGKGIAVAAHESIPRGYVDNVTKTISRLPAEFLSKSGDPKVSVVKQIISASGKANGLYISSNNTIQIQAGGNPFHVSLTV
jgi:hypothetical protein